MAFTSSASLSPFAQHLVSEGLLVEAQARELADQARAEETPLSVYLENKKWVNATSLAEATSRFFSLPLYNLDAHQADKMPVEFMSLDVVQKGYAIPLLRRKNTLFFGVADPESVNASEMSFALGVQIKLVIVEAGKLHSLASDMREAQTVAGLENISENALSSLEITAYEEPKEAPLTANIEDKPVVSYINQLLLEAIKIKASDIHFEPFEKYFRIRYRVDGILHEASRSPSQAAGPLAARLKVLAGLDIAEHRLPQDGRFKITLAKNKTIDFRISTCPTIYGEKVVLRILDPDAMPLDIAALGMEEAQQKLYLKAINDPQGIILVTGPTGSGKTVSLYTAIKLLNSIQKNICTIEDPIEIYMPGINQVHMNAKIGMTFAKAMRSFLRQDPDIIMVGEIRDLETADIAVKAAQTGHLVLSTLHTNSAPMTVVRLINIGLESYNIASTLSLVVAQRLARKLCKHCKKPKEVPKDILIQQGFTEKETEITLYEPGECSKCTNGYKGRVGIFEVMSITPALRDLIMHNADTSQLTEQAKKDGMLTLRQSGLLKVKAGITSLEELNRIITLME
ncbi:MAG: type IV-A pilus assembly ATPase PilB [Gammaproteobacteria bacterium CG_4_10_14_0_8_um_filter_38_16]|nr:MAG: type IV-A pilus assembly ATPase PilB [Gammaproteobacteria bacterium CG_4_10_14_0_8_um_filter_38_16]PJA03171.1 MAG: type IV-A pilus assembly ATPase PilB [Gammaproteobacteria bacterium CG_4_10_14_0_2_um_filter_38_22]PJB09963.1 MAG: type IV-A pilus assembly ATPase PilB [Gammaproteobacteria bacterium CG_4_9_14_3_um_filter_38_9]